MTGRLVPVDFSTKACSALSSERSGEADGTWAAGAIPRRIVLRLRVLCLLLPGLILGLPSPARADEAISCSATVLKSLGSYVGTTHFVHPEGQADGVGRVVQDRCMAWPADPAVTLALAVYTDAPLRAGDDVEAWNVVVAMLDTHSAKLLAASKEEGGSADVTYGLGDYAFDTASYRLAPGVMAFGVIDHNQKSVHCAETSAGPGLTLWVRDKNRLRPVFGTNLEGSVTTEGVGCAGASGPLRTENARMTVAVEKTRANGFADLSINAHIVASVSDAKGYRQEPERVRRTVLKYDGKSYGIDMFRDFWYPASVK